MLKKHYHYLYVGPNAQINRRRSAKGTNTGIKMAKPLPVLASALNRQLERCHFKASLGAAEELMAFARLLLVDGRP